MKRERKIAIFLDFDNIKLGLDINQTHFSVKKIVHYLNLKGQVVLSKAYGDWDKMANVSKDELEDKKEIKESEFKELSKIKDQKSRNHKKHQIKTKFKKSLDKLRLKKTKQVRKIKKELVEYGFDIVDMPSRISGKNFSDIQLVVDCLETSIINKSINTIAIISGDSDMTPLIKKIRYYGLEVIVIGVEESMSKMFATTSDIFRFYKFLDLKLVSPNEMTNSPYLVLCKVVSLCRKVFGSSIIDKNKLVNRFNIFFNNTDNKDLSFSELLYISKKQELIDYEEDTDKNKIKIISDSSNLLPPLSVFQYEINYTEINETAEYIMLSEERKAELLKDEDKLFDFFTELIQDFISYALFTDSTITYVVNSLFYPNKPDKSDEEYIRVNDCLKKALMTLNRNKIIEYSEDEKIYIPYQSDKYARKFTFKREIERLKKSITNTNKEKSELTQKIKAYEQMSETYGKLIEAIKLIDYSTDIEQAVSLLNEVIETPYYKKTAKIYLAKIYIKTGNFERAIDICSELVKDGIKYPILFNILGIAYAKLKDYKNALENFEESLSLYDNQPKIIQYVKGINQLSYL